MKYISVVLCVMLLLSGCQKTTDEENEVVSVETSDSENDLEQEIKVTEDHKAEYHIETVENITKNSTGGKVAEISFEKVVFEDSEREVLTERMEDAAEDFFSEYEEMFQEYVSFGEESDYREGYFPYYCTSKVKSVYEKDGYVSIQTEMEWYAGGIATTDRGGYNYQVKTGTPVNLLDVSGLSEDEVWKCISEGLDEQGIALDDYSAELLNGYSARNLQFYMDEQGIYVTFYTGELAAMAEGCIVIPILTF